MPSSQWSGWADLRRRSHVKSAGSGETEHAGVGPFQRLVGNNLLWQPQCVQAAIVKSRHSETHSRRKYMGNLVIGSDVSALGVPPNP